jgi:hypothetical protein
MGENNLPLLTRPELPNQPTIWSPVRGPLATKPMSFPTPAETAVETENTATVTEEAPIYDGRMEEMEDYWAVIDTERFLQKLCLTLDVAVDGEFARYTDAEGESPIADHGLFYYRTKKDMAGDLADRRSEGDLNDDQNLPNYKDQFGELEQDHTVITKDNAEDFGLDADLFEDDEEISLPDEYEPETDDEGNLVVWYNQDGDYSQNDVLTALNAVKGIGPKTAGRALNALQDAGIVDSDL